MRRLVLVLLLVLAAAALAAWHWVALPMLRTSARLVAVQELRLATSDQTVAPGVTHGERPGQVNQTWAAPVTWSNYCLAARPGSGGVQWTELAKVRNRCSWSNSRITAWTSPGGS